MVAMLESVHNRLTKALSIMLGIIYGTNGKNSHHFGEAYLQGKMFC